MLFFCPLLFLVLLSSWSRPHLLTPRPPFALIFSPERPYSLRSLFIEVSLTQHSLHPTKSAAAKYLASFEFRVSCRSLVVLSSPITYSKELLATMHRFQPAPFFLVKMPLFPHSPRSC
ncbi:hypothetical protein F4815DRAFT_240163 [Daldinia loculata]|nr:hypothetical protein F4815DRAFT_240163 [Daldinia loculata]